MTWNDLRKGRFSQSEGEYFVTFNTQNRQPHFKNFQLACLFCQQISINEEQHHCTWLTWVLMPDHFHGLLRLGIEGSTLSEVVGSLKGSSSFILNNKRQQQEKIWQASYFDRALRLEDDRKNISRYIVANPLRKDLVNNVGNYSFWNSIYL